MADDIVKMLRSVLDPEMPLSERAAIEAAIAEIERLWELCNDLYHNATCAESFCTLCGDGIREWEARRG